MKKILLIALILIPILIIFPNAIQAKECPPPPNAPALYLVHCGQDASCPCEIGDFFAMLARIYNFLVWNIAGPLAILAITIGAVVLMTSAGNPAQAGTGKKILWAAIIGLVLVFLSWLIINTILEAIGYTGAWNVF